jgi:hypothetical protein
MQLDLLWFGRARSDQARMARMIRMSASDSSRLNANFFAKNSSFHTSLHTRHSDRCVSARSPLVSCVTESAFTNHVKD